MVAYMRYIFKTVGCITHLASGLYVSRDTKWIGEGDYLQTSVISLVNRIIRRHVMGTLHLSPHVGLFSIWRFPNFEPNLTLQTGRLDVCLSKNCPTFL